MKARIFLAIIIVLMICLSTLADGRVKDRPGLSCPTPCFKCVGCIDPDDPSTWCTDTNRDGYTTLPDDILEILMNWGEVQYECVLWQICPRNDPDCDPCLVRSCLNCNADVNGDEMIDTFDLLQVIERVNKCRHGGG